MENEMIDDEDSSDLGFAEAFPDSELYVSFHGGCVTVDGLSANPAELRWIADRLERYRAER